MAKKTFKDNPALQFISAAEELTPDPPAPALPVTPRPGEAKSRRVQLVLPPSLYERVKQRAAAQGLSVNEYVCRVLEQNAR